MSHIAVERKRRRQMNENLKVLRSLTPSFYIKRGDQASIIGGVIEFIKELQQVLESLESKKRQNSLSPYKLQVQSPRVIMPLFQRSPPSESSLITTTTTPFQTADVKELGACCNSSIANVEAKISGANVILRTVSRRNIPGQVVKMINVLEKHCFEILHLNITTVEDTVLHSFVIKIGLECQLSVDELAAEVQKSFCSKVAN